MRLENVETKMPAHFNMCSYAFIIKRNTEKRAPGIAERESDSEVRFKMDQTTFACM